MTAIEELLSTALSDTGNGWSIGTFGAIAEFRRDADEPADCFHQSGWQQCITGRGAIGLHTHYDAVPVAYETLSSDGETWGHTLAFCLPPPSEPSAGVVFCKGADPESLRPSPRDELLFDLGVGSGHVSFSVRTSEPTLIDVLRAAEGKPLLSEDCAAVRAALVERGPPRIACSPIGRIEVYSAIPPPGGRSPSGLHTHLLPKLLASRRPHSANAPIPPGLQPVLTLHPPSAWRDAAGARIPFNATADEYFQGLLERFGLAQDKAVRLATETAVIGGADPATHSWPTTRRGRAQARITHRRLAQRLGAGRLSGWRALYDRSSSIEDGSEELQTADSALRQ